jgi:hypothetical protein
MGLKLNALFCIKSFFAENSSWAKYHGSCQCPQPPVLVVVKDLVRRIVLVACIYENFELYRYS